MFHRSRYHPQLVCSRILLRALVLIGLLLITHHSSLITVRGQSATATLSGTVVDSNSAVIPDARITLLNNATSLKRQTTTNDDGYFTLPLLPPGTYTLTTQRDGFTTAKIPDLTLNVGDQRSLQIQLKAGDVKAEVQITSDAPLINESPAVATTIDRQFVENLPLNGRSFQSLFTLTPGVVLTAAGGLTSRGQFSVNGQRPDSNYITVDGVSANLGVQSDTGIGQEAAGALPGLAATGGTNNLVSIDALQEFRILTSTYAPEYGRMPGGQISLVTRSGTNQFRGSVFNYLRNDVFDANDWFANRSNLPKPRLRQNSFGGVLGGPVLKNRTFFFASYEGLRLRQPLTGTSEVPSLASRDAAPASIKPFLNAFPRPNGPETSNGLALHSASFSNPISFDSASVRIDHILTSRMTVFGRYNYAPSNSIIRARFGGALNQYRPLRLITRTLTGGASFVISPRVINDLRLNWSKHRGSESNELDELGGAIPMTREGFLPPGVSSETGHFNFDLGGPTRIQLGAGVESVSRQLNLVDNTSVAFGKHQFKFGFDHRRFSYDYVPLSYNATARFAGATGAVTGQVISGGNILAFAGSRFITTDTFSAYMQDAWKPAARLTITYGFRWELNAYPSERNGNDPPALVGLDNPATISLAPVGTPLWKTRYRNLAPRVGIALQLVETPGHETVLRGGFGIFYDLVYGSVLNAFSEGWPSLTRGQYRLVPHSRSVPQTRRHQVWNRCYRQIGRSSLLTLT